MNRVKTETLIIKGKVVSVFISYKCYSMNYINNK